jgi:hypothetical protein
MAYSNVSGIIFISHGYWFNSTIKGPGMSPGCIPIKYRTGFTTGLGSSCAPASKVTCRRQLNANTLIFIFIA